VKGIASLVVLVLAALGATSSAAAPSRLVEVTGVARRDGRPALVSMLLAVPRGRSVAAARTAALRAEHAAPVFAFAGQKWMRFLDHDPTNDTVQQLYDATGDPTGSGGETLAISAATWSAVPGSSFRLQTAGTSTAEPGVFDHVNVVGWSTDPERFPPGVLALTSTFFNSTTGGLIDADIVINGNVTWSNAAEAPPSGAYDLESVLTHEDGHVAGLAHSADPAAVMFPTLGSGVTRRTLGQDDVGAISTLYPTLTCHVPKLRNRRLAAAKVSITSAGCSVGSVRRVFSRVIRRGRVISQKPVGGTVWPGGTKVRLVVSKGRRMA
jgi:hypothetical protein